MWLQWAENFQRPRTFWVLVLPPGKQKPRWACRDILLGTHRGAGSVLQRRQNSELPRRDCSGAVFQVGDFQSRAVRVARNRGVERHDSGLGNAGHCHENPRGCRCFENLAAKHISTAASCERHLVRLGAPHGDGRRGDRNGHHHGCCRNPARDRFHGRNSGQAHWRRAMNNFAKTYSWGRNSAARRRSSRVGVLPAPTRRVRANFRAAARLYVLGNVRARVRWPEHFASRVVRLKLRRSNRLVRRTRHWMTLSRATRRAAIRRNAIPLRAQWRQDAIQFL